MDLSREQLNARSPLGGMNRTDDIVWSWPCRVLRMAYAFVESHTFNVKSDEHDTAHYQLFHGLREVSLKSFPSKLKSTSLTAFVWPLIVCSNSPVSQSQIFIVESSEQVAKTVKVGWNAKPVTGIRWPDKLWRAGVLGSQDIGSRFFCRMEAGAESSSTWRACNRASKSMIYRQSTKLNMRLAANREWDIWPFSAVLLHWSTSSLAGLYTSGHHRRLAVCVDCKMCQVAPAHLEGYCTMLASSMSIGMIE